MGGGERRADLPHQIDAQPDIERSLTEQLAQALAARKLHHDVGAVVADAVIINLNNVGMAQRGGRSRLSAKALPHLFVAAQGREQQFDRHRAIQTQLCSLEHRAHPAATDQPLYAVTPGQRRSGLHSVPASGGGGVGRSQIGISVQHLVHCLLSIRSGFRIGRMSAAQHTPVLREIAGLQIHSGPGFVLKDVPGGYRFRGRRC